MASPPCRAPIARGVEHEAVVPVRRATGGMAAARAGVGRRPRRRPQHRARARRTRRGQDAPRHGVRASGRGRRWDRPLRRVSRRRRAAVRRDRRRARASARARARARPRRSRDANACSRAPSSRSPMAVRARPTTSGMTPACDVLRRHRRPARRGGPVGTRPARARRSPMGPPADTAARRPPAPLAVAGPALHPRHPSRHARRRRRRVHRRARRPAPRRRHRSRARARARRLGRACVRRARGGRRSRRRARTGGRGPARARPMAIRSCSANCGTTSSTWARSVPDGRGLARHRRPRRPHHAGERAVGRRPSHRSLARRRPRVARSRRSRGLALRRRSARGRDEHRAPYASSNSSNPRSRRERSNKWARRRSGSPTNSSRARSYERLAPARKASAHFDLANRDRAPRCLRPDPARPRRATRSPRSRSSTYKTQIAVTTRAADAAMRAYAYEDAVELLNSVLPFVDAAADRAELLLRIAKAEIPAGEIERSREHLRTAIDLARSVGALRPRAPRRARRSRRVAGASDFPATKPSVSCVKRCLTPPTSRRACARSRPGAARSHSRAIRRRKT